MSVEDVSLNNVCNIKRFQMLYNIPSYRYTPISPYPKYTQEQLNMRRKAEILKYKSNNQSSKANGTTKSKAWSALVNNRTNRPPIICDQNQDMIPTPTYYSDVPGPAQLLYCDTTIPLYNYSTNTNAYGITPLPTNNNMWNLISSNNLIFSNNDDLSTLFRLFILDAIDKPNYDFTFQTPFAISMEGVQKTSNVAAWDISLNITHIDSIVTYNDVQLQDVTVNTSYDMSKVAFRCNPPNYNMFLYTGLLTMNIPGLYTKPGFIYDLKMKFSVSISTGKPSVDLSNATYFDQYTTTRTALYCNLSTPNLLSPSNCIIYDLSATSYIPYNIVGSPN